MTAPALGYEQWLTAQARERAETLRAEGAGIVPIPKTPGISTRPAQQCRHCRYKLDPVLVQGGHDAHPNCAEAAGAEQQAQALITPTPPPWPWRNAQPQEPMPMQQPEPAPIIQALTPQAETLTSKQVGAVIKAELLAAWKAHADNRARSLQTAIGPSEIGSPCKRRLMYKMLGAQPVNFPDQWASWMGTQGHAGMEEAVAQHAARTAQLHRWLTEHRVQVDDELGGNSDLIDLLLAAIVDHKFVGTTTMREARRSGPVQQYLIQANIYGKAAKRQGIDIKHIVIVYWPRTGFRAEPFVWSGPYQEEVADRALADHAALQRLRDAAGWGALQVLPAVDAHCTFCPMWAPGSTDLGRGCPGAAQVEQREQRDSVHSLIAP